MYRTKCLGLLIFSVLLVDVYGCHKHDRDPSPEHGQDHGNTPEICTDTCSSLGQSCGSVCGQLCGECAGNEGCISGTCMPATTENCDDCSLKLSLIDQRRVNGTIQSVTLAIDYAPTEEQLRPRIADLRLVSSLPAVLSSVEAGAALNAAGKDFFVDPATLKPWRKRADGSWQLLILSTLNSNSINAGRIATLTYDVNSRSAISFSLVKRPETFAPADADDAINSTSYGKGVVVLP